MQWFSSLIDESKIKNNFTSSSYRFDIANQTDVLDYCTKWWKNCTGCLNYRTKWLTWVYKHIGPIYTYIRIMNYIQKNLLKVIESNLKG